MLITAWFAPERGWGARAVSAWQVVENLRCLAKSARERRVRWMRPGSSERCVLMQMGERLGRERSPQDGLLKWTAVVVRVR